MDPIETQIAFYEAERARHKKLGFRFGFIAIGFLVLNMISGIIFSALSNFGDGSSLAVFQVSEIFQIGLPVFGILGIVQRNKAVKARDMLRNLQLIQMQTQAQGATPKAAAPQASEPAEKPATSSRAAKAAKNKS